MAIRSTIVFLALFFFAITIPNRAFAQGTPWDPTCIVDNVATLACIPGVFKNIVNGALMFAGVVALFMVAYSGIRYVTSRGDPKAVESAKNTLTWTIIGLVVIVLAYTIINFLAYFTGAGICITQFGFGNCQ